ncbi:sulfite exporter TauE/SafE family protein [Uliginosibacterium gangwonense]|uniref:sulfite exporter TauE/SafE family protein n=1 Tax=Uliginosibacterium gangwonense TaxID=392736 RepID=UPI000360BEF6|nr:sulfite exporter TauE/SafE family protein [Uliginosibacterium gangwonense]
MHLPFALPDVGYLAVFVLGLLGGAHCIGMCGGIVSALSLPGQGGGSIWWRQLAYNLGRICTYTLLGTLAGAVGSASLVFNDFLPVQMTLYVIANCMMLGMGLYLMGLTQVFLPLERMGQRLWRVVQPLSKPFVRGRSMASAFPLGLLWGLLPCGLTYGVLSTAVMSGSALNGGALMLAFGAGTLPNLLLAGVLLARYGKVVRGRAFRTGAGLFVMAFAIYGLVRAPELGGKLWAGVICKV